MKVERNFIYDETELGAIELVAPDGKWTLNGKELPEASVAYWLWYGGRCLQDCYASAKTDAEREGAYAKRYDKLLAGTVGIRSGGDGAGFETIVARSVMRGAFMAQYGKDSPERAAFLALSKSDENAKLDEWLDGEAGEQLADAIAAEIELRKARAANKVKAAKAVTFKL